ncbi:hypothetical protein L218DRAFT_963593 [Marasmius fiardii PR-910]|nr:hypothetical protein L218DRAFT_963593 [Marasmius fiardii PR-910]
MGKKDFYDAGLPGFKLEEYGSVHGGIDENHDCSPERITGTARLPTASREWGLF